MLGSITLRPAWVTWAPLTMLFGTPVLLTAAQNQERELTPQPFEERLTAPDAAADDQFGLGVALHGDTALVGALGHDHIGTDAGAAFVYRNEQGTWRFEAELLASDGAAGDEFGLRVALHGDTALVGAPLHDFAGTDSGAAYVYRRLGGVWVEEQKLVPALPSAGDQFGRWVCLQGDVAVLSAHHATVGTLADAGRAYVFRRVGGTWVEEARLESPEPQAGAWFARSVSIAGDTLVVGAVFEDHLGQVDAGSVYVFERNAGQWKATTRLRAHDAAAGDQFGNSVFLRRGVLIVGANRDDFGGLADAGSAYVFTRAGAGWSSALKVTAPDAQAGARFGRSVSTDGVRLAVGAIFDDNHAGLDAGAAYLFHRRQGAWTLQRKHVPAQGAPGDFLGYTVAVDGALGLAGSYLHDPGAVQEAGAAFLF